MQPFQTLTSQVIRLPYDNIDTDQIIPARYLKVTDKAGLAEGLFYGWRFLSNGTPNPDFPLNQPEYRNAQILLAGDNFGCGSSREHAPWALVGWGIRAVISTSFADIFRNNALKNGLLPVQVDYRTHQVLLNSNAIQPELIVTIDLQQQLLELPDGQTAEFPIDHFNKMCLLEGLDSLGYLLKHQGEIENYERMWNK